MKTFALPEGFRVILLQKANYMPLQEQVELDPVSVSRRLLNFLIDLSCWASLLFLVSKTVDLSEFTDKDVMGFSLLSASFLLYYVVLEIFFQQTLGKFITGTKVVTLDGKKPGIKIIILRSLCRLIPLDKFSFLFTRRGFHDYLSGTTVIDLSDQGSFSGRGQKLAENQLL